MEEGKEVKRGQSEGSVARRENYGREGGRLRSEWCASCKKKGNIEGELQVMKRHGTRAKGIMILEKRRGG